MLYFISIHLYILENVLSFFHKFKNVIKKSVYWIYGYISNILDN